MVHDPITDEIRAIRRALAAKFDNDIQRIGEDIRRQQHESGRTYVRLPKREPRYAASTNKPMHTNGGASVIGLDTSSPAAE